MWRDVFFGLSWLEKACFLCWFPFCQTLYIYKYRWLIWSVSGSWVQNKFHTVEIQQCFLWCRNLCHRNLNAQFSFFFFFYWGSDCLFFSLVYLLFTLNKANSVPIHFKKVLIARVPSKQKQLSHHEVHPGEMVRFSYLLTPWK